MTSSSHLNDLIVERARRFRALHHRDRPFVIPNPWDAGSARLLTAAGFEALATTSAGFAASAGFADGTLDLDETLANIAAVSHATHLPVSADLEAGFGRDPAAVAATVAAAAGAGAVGGSIEDLAARTDGSHDLVDLGLAVERIEAAADAAAALTFDFVLTARCEAFTIGRPDLGVTIERLQAYQRAGADVVYAPGLSTLDQIRAVVRAVDVPVNVVMGLGRAAFSVTELGEVGVRRISVGSALARVAYGALLRAVGEITEHGTFCWSADAVPYTDLVSMLPPAPTGAAE